MRLAPTLRWRSTSARNIPADRTRAEESLRLTMAWAQRSLMHFRANQHEVPWAGDFPGRTQSLFGIVQGGMYRDLRRESAERLIEMDFDGYAIGGLSVGEPRDLTLEMISEVLPMLPKDKPRYVMGVGYPDEIELYARMGVDMMDCVLPTRAARHGLLFTSEGRITIKNKQFAEDQGPPDPNCDCMVCRRYSRAYLRHLMQAGEALSGTLNSIHNLAYYLGIMRRVRQSLEPAGAAIQSRKKGCSEPLILSLETARFVMFTDHPRAALQPSRSRGGSLRGTHA